VQISRLALPVVSSSVASLSLVCLVLRRCRRLPLPCSRCSAHILAPRVYLSGLCGKPKRGSRDGGGGQGPHLHEQDFGRTIRGTGGALLLLTGWLCVKERKKKTETPREGWRTARRHHTGILRRGVWCASLRPPLGVSASSYISLRSLSPILAATFVPPRGRPLLVVLSLVASCSWVVRKNSTSRVEFLRKILPHSGGFRERRGARLKSARSMSTVRASRGLFERALLALPVGENARVFLGVCTVVGVAGAFTASSTLFSPLPSAHAPRSRC